MNGDVFGEVNENNYLHGRGIEIENDVFIEIGYYENGRLSTGNYIYIHSDGVFLVGERYIKEGERRDRWTCYKTDGTEKKYDR